MKQLQIMEACNKKYFLTGNDSAIIGIFECSKIIQEQPNERLQKYSGIAKPKTAARLIHI